VGERLVIGVCPFCSKAVSQGERLYREVLGWEEERKQGGTNALRVRLPTGTVAHWHCVDLAAHGRTGQLEI
jgi:hypothetical protein